MICLDFVLPGILGDLNSFRKSKLNTHRERERKTNIQVSNSHSSIILIYSDFERPIALAGKKNATEHEKEEGRVASLELEKITSAFMIRRHQSDVLASTLPPRKEMLLFCRPSATQCTLYKEYTSRPSDDRLSTLMTLRKLCSHPSLIHDGDNETSSSGKLYIMEKLLISIYETNPMDKVVIVSNFTSALSLIQHSILKPKGWSSLRLDGTTEQSVRQSLVNSFNRGTRDSCFVFLLSSKAGGCGLNLIGANRLIMFDLGRCIMKYLSICLFSFNKMVFSLIYFFLDCCKIGILQLTLKPWLVFTVINKQSLALYTGF